VPLPEVPRQNAGLDAQPETPHTSPPADLRVADVRLDMRVLPMGVDAAGAMDLPADTAEAGWYRFGPAPGEAGTTVLAAHVDSLVTGLGAFARLRDVPVGAAVTVTTADGAAHGYRVTDVERTPKTEVPLDLLFQRSGDERLVLVTCGGEFDRRTGHYRDNVIVTAIPDP
jgi:LPXTG-site transpeptidase (sortase) family protein